MTYSNDDYNAGIAKVFERRVQENAAATITGNQAHEPNKASYRSELADARPRAGRKPLAIFAYYGSSGITIIKQQPGKRPVRQVLRG